MTALQALRKARATVECGESGIGSERWDALLPECGVYNASMFAWFRGEFDDPKESHRAVSSAALDGLSVSAVTRAEEALDREARRGR